MNCRYRLPLSKGTFFLIAFIFVTATTCVAQKAGMNDVAIAFYNCENFFDIADNPNKADDEFTPTGKYHYTLKIYEQKLHNIATVLQSMDGPAIIGLAEIENTTVLNDLVRQPEIARSSYKYVWFDGPDVRGINVAMLYDPKHFRVIKSEPVTVALSGIEANAKTRDVLYTCGVLDGDTVYVLVNHWPSNRGENSEPKRLKAAEVDMRVVRDINAKHPNARVIIMGDFNNNPPGDLISRVMGADAVSGKVKGAKLYNPFGAIFARGEGTEIYQHKWNLFDMIIVSGTLLENKRHGLQYKDAKIFKPDFLVDHHKGHEGEPKRSFVGTHWINGYSDHFPVILYLEKK